jgi:hypothetical protein
MTLEHGVFALFLQFNRFAFIFMHHCTEIIFCLRRSATSRKVPGLRPDEINDIYEFIESFLPH